MADSATHTNSILDAGMARRLIARPIRRHVASIPRTTPPPRPFDLPPERVRQPERDQDQYQEPVVAQQEPSATPKRLEAEVRLMKAVIEAERRENANLRACVDEEEEELGDEARAVRERWMRVVDKLLQAAV